MLNYVAASTSARAAAEELFAEECEGRVITVHPCELVRAWNERVERVYEGLEYYGLHRAPHWFYTDTREEMFDITVTADNIDALEAELDERAAREARELEEASALLRELEAELAARPDDVELASFYSDVHKDVYGFRPRW